jgi:crossover junction endodeoxyribonuclease RusA
MQVNFSLPWPPTVNSYYVKAKRGVFISKAGITFRDACNSALNEQMCLGLRLDYRLSVQVILYPPDKRCRDLDNYMKALLDALTHAKVWVDDEQIDELAIHRGKVITSGKTLVQITEHHGMIMPDDENVWDFLE